MIGCDIYHNCECTVENAESVTITYTFMYIYYIIIVGHSLLYLQFNTFTLLHYNTIYTYNICRYA